MPIVRFNLQFLEGIRGAWEDVVPNILGPKMALFFVNDATTVSPMLDA